MFKSFYVVCQNAKLSCICLKRPLKPGVGADLCTILYQATHLICYFEVIILLGKRFIDNILRSDTCFTCKHHFPSHTRCCRSGHCWHTLARRYEDRAWSHSSLQHHTHHTCTHMSILWFNLSHGIDTHNMAK